jgi:hypothetical protein
MQSDLTSWLDFMASLSTLTKSWNTFIPFCYNLWTFCKNVPVARFSLRNEHAKQNIPSLHLLFDKVSKKSNGAV